MFELLHRHDIIVKQLKSYLNKKVNFHKNTKVYFLTKGRFIVLQEKYLSVRIDDEGNLKRIFHTDSSAEKLPDTTAVDEVLDARGETPRQTVGIDFQRRFVLEVVFALDLVGVLLCQEILARAERNACEQDCNVFFHNALPP